MVSTHSEAPPTETACCDLCGGSEGECVLEKDGASYRQCSSCGFVFTHPPMPDVAGVNDAAFTERLDYYVAKSFNPRKQAAYRRRLRPFARYRQTNRFLEIGCNVGGLIYQAREQGWEPTGVEPVDVCARYGREQYSLNIVTGLMEDAQLQESTFDVVYSHAVIEHVTSPMALLRESHRVLRPGGVTCHETVNYDSYTRRLIGGDWRLMSPIGHPSLFSPATMREFCTRAGLEVVWIHTSGVRLRPNAAARLGGLRRMLDEARKLPLSVAARLAQKGDTISVLARKP